MSGSYKYDKLICVSVEWKDERTEAGLSSTLYLKTQDTPWIQLESVKLNGDNAALLEKAKLESEISIFGQPASFSSLPVMSVQPLLCVDMTPNKDFVLRILEAYRKNCDCRWESDSSNVLYQLMNKHNDMRKKFLDKAIARLSRIRENR